LKKSVSLNPPVDAGLLVDEVAVLPDDEVVAGLLVAVARAGTLGVKTLGTVVMRWMSSLDVSYYAGLCQ